MKIEIEGKLPSMNEIIDATKSHWGAYAAMKKENTDLVAWSAKKLPKIKSANIIITWFCENKRKDKDNIMAGQKFIFDGLMKSGIIANDGWSQIGEVTHRFAVDKKRPRVEIELVDMEV